MSMQIAPTPRIFSSDFIKKGKQKFPYRRIDIFPSAVKRTHSVESAEHLLGYRRTNFPVDSKQIFHRTQRKKRCQFVRSTRRRSFAHGKKLPEQTNAHLTLPRNSTGTEYPIDRTDLWPTQQGDPINWKVCLPHVHELTIQFFTLEQIFHLTEQIDFVRKPELCSVNQQICLPTSKQQFNQFY